MRDPKRRALVLRMVKATGLSEPSVYACLNLGRRPTGKLAGKAWDRVMDSYQRREALKAAKAAHAAPAPAAEVAP